MFDKNIFSERLRLLRKQNNLTLEKLGVELNLTKQTISRWETSDRLPTLDTLCSLCEHLNISANYILGLSDEPEPLYTKENK